MKVRIHSNPLKLGNGQLISFHVYWACDYLSVMRLKLLHVSKNYPYCDWADDAEPHFPVFFVQLTHWPSKYGSNFKTTYIFKLVL